MSSLESLADFSMKIREGHAGFSPKISTVRKKNHFTGRGNIFHMSNEIHIFNIYLQRKIDTYLADVKQKRLHFSQLCRIGRIPYLKAIKRNQKGDVAKHVLFDRGKEFSLLTGK